MEAAAFMNSSEVRIIQTRLGAPAATFLLSSCNKTSIDVFRKEANKLETAVVEEAATGPVGGVRSGLLLSERPGFAST